MAETILVTGGAGFIGSCYVRRSAANSQRHIVILDKLTYAGNLSSIATVSKEQSTFVRGDICDFELVTSLLESFSPQAIINFAAESHVDRSIDGPLAFVQTNVMGTAVLLEAARRYYGRLEKERASRFRFLQISTDEVYGSLGEHGAFTESSPYSPRSPYAGTKAASDHLVRAYSATYQLPAIVTNCSNNYGPFQYPEKLIPLMILNALERRSLPVYGDGLHVRDWLYVEDHCEAIDRVVSLGKTGATYNIGGGCELTNLELVKMICRIVQLLCPQLAYRCEDLITFVPDRPGHDRRYAIDSSKLRNELNWRPQVNLETGLQQTVRWYIDNTRWVTEACHGKYDRERLGI